MQPTTDAEPATAGGDDAAALRRTAETAAALRERLAALPLVVEDARCAAFDVAVASYPGGARPSGRIELRGAGEVGRGEHVGWTRDAHLAFGERVRRLPLERCRRVEEVTRLAAGVLDDPYDRAALEAAAIDLALRQAQTSLARLAGSAAATVRYVVSFERVDDPVARAEREIAAGAPGLKVDADPGWSEETYAALDRLGRVAVLDFKLSGRPAEHERAHRLVPGALLEDPLPGDEPWSAELRRRLSLDAAIVSVRALAALPALPAAVNVKPARMGGVLEALAAVAWSAARGLVPYIGGMFEVGVGRAQLQALAAIVSPDGPNDVAPIGVAGRRPARPPRLPSPVPDAGFAAACDGQEEERR